MVLIWMLACWGLLVLLVWAFTRTQRYRRWNSAHKFSCHANFYSLSCDIESSSSSLSSSSVGDDFVDDGARDLPLLPHSDFSSFSASSTSSAFASSGGFVFLKSVMQCSAATKCKLQQWYSCGSAFAVVALVVAVVMLTVSLWQSSVRLFAHLLAWMEGTTSSPLSASSSSAVPQVNFQVAIPGLTVPLSHVLYLWLAVAVSVAFHELGHAVAAAVHGVRTKRVGAFLLVFFPGAFVELDRVERLSVTQKLRVSAAGVWHNFLLCLLCALLLFASPLWSCIISRPGVFISDVAPNSGLASFLPHNTELIAVDGTPMSSLDDLQAYLAQFHSHPSTASASSSTSKPTSFPAQLGFCVEVDFLREQWELNGDRCCDPQHADAQRLTCFRTLHHRHYHGGGTAAAVMGKDHPAASSQDQEVEGRSCFSVRQHLSGLSVTRCQASPCLASLGRMAKGVCSIPVLLDDNNQDQDGGVQRVFTLLVSGQSQHVVYAGTASELRSSLVVSDRVPRDWWLRFIAVLGPAAGWVVPVHPSDSILLLLRYIIAVSASLALLNSAPIYLADGSWTVSLLYERWFGSSGGDSNPTVVKVVLAAGSCLLIANVLTSAAVGFFL